MQVFVLGLSYRSAPLDLLERLAVDPERRPKALRLLVDQEHVTEGVILSTCNRLEVYAAVRRYHGGMADVRRFLADLHHVDQAEFADLAYTYHEERAVQHLFAVASGIDSMVLGEAEILGQVREAFQAAQAERTTGPVLSALFTQAIRVGRRARAETGISRTLDSTVSVGLDLATRHLGSLAGRRVLLVGAGRTGGLAARALRRAGAGELVVANRTTSRAEALVAKVGGRPVPLEAIGEELAAADLLVAATAAATPTVSAATVARALQRRGRRQPLVVLDLGVPRDVEPAVRELDGVVLADLDALRAVLETGESRAREEVARVRQIIAEETRAFMSGQRSARLAPTIRALRARAERLRQQELARVAPKLAGLDERERAAVEALTRGLVNKLLHEPTVRGKELAARPDGDLYAALLRDLFGLEGDGGA